MVSETSPVLSVPIGGGVAHSTLRTFANFSMVFTVGNCTATASLVCLPQELLALSYIWYQNVNVFWNTSHHHKIIHRNFHLLRYSLLTLRLYFSIIWLFVNEIVFAISLASYNEKLTLTMKQNLWQIAGSFAINQGG